MGVIAVAGITPNPIILLQGKSHQDLLCKKTHKKSGR
jgi:hypothetical protein